MGRRIVRWPSTSVPTATADATALANSVTTAGYAGILQGVSATAISRMWEISINGQAASTSSPTPMTLARDSTIAVTVGTVTNSDTVMDSSSTAAAALTGNAWTTAPQRSATLRLMSCALNAFGGSFFWRGNRIEECPAIVGASVNTGEMSLSCFTGGTPGQIDTHYIYETA